MQRRWCGTLWPTPAGAQQAGMSTGDFAALVERALFLDRDDPVAAWGELHDTQARLIERLSGASELRIEAEGTDLRLRVDGPHVGQLRRQAQHALGRGLHRPARGLAPRARSATRSRRARAAWRSRASSWRSEGGRVVEARAERGEEYLRDDARHRRRRLAARRDRHRHELRHRPPGRDDPVRREDRRHRPPRGRPLLPGDRRHERVGRPLGHDLRPPPAAAA